jgi:hypothetical protein
LKNAQRLDFAGLAEILGQRELVEIDRLHLALQTGLQGSSPFPEILVNDSMMGDWELSRVVCELYSLPFVPVDIYVPAENILEGLDRDFLRKHRLVPTGRHGNLLTVAMPAIVSADVLGMLGATADLHVMPVVGSVKSNNRWIDEHLPAEVESDLADGEAASNEADWGNLFDEGDASVLMDLTPEGPQSEPHDPDLQIEPIDPGLTG